MTVETRQPQDPPEQAFVGVPSRGLKGVAYRASRNLLAPRTIYLMSADMLKLRARVRHLGRREKTPSADKLHLGAASRRLSGWLNVDVTGSDYDIDFTRRLPWKAGSFSTVVSQHVIEHLELFTELLPVLGELRRVMHPGGEIWLSCPDMEKICQLYVNGQSAELLADWIGRDKWYSVHGAPAQQIVNDIFHQWGEHKNLFDSGLARWALESAGFSDVRQVREADLLERFPGFPAQGDDLITLYVTARA